MFRKAKFFYKKYGELTSFCIGVFGLIFGLIQYFYPYTSKADLKYFIKESINVISIRENVEAIKIHFNDREIRKDSLSLKIFKIRLKNEGRSPVAQTDYASIPFGLHLQNGTIVSVRHEASSSYLKENITPNLKDSTRILLSKCIIDFDQFIDFEVLVVHRLSEIPEFSALGKIADAESIEVIVGNDDKAPFLGLIRASLKQQL